MKNLTFCLLLITAACSKSVQPTKKTDAVNIISFFMPASAAVSQPVQIKAIAQANNGCWHDFKFGLVKTNDFEYSLNATATFESKGMCAAVIVEKDTTISFIPDKKGRYIFRLNKAPFTTIADTLTVQ